MNIIKLLGIGYKEDIISNLLIGLINGSEVFKNTFINKIVGIENPELYKVETFVRVNTSKGEPDIILKIHNESTDILAIIENKLKAEEGYEQTKRYSDENCIRELCLKSDINMDYENISTKFIYLTLLPEQIPTGDMFINKTYKDILDDVNVDIESNKLDYLYKDFLSMLEDFYSGLEVNLNDSLLQVICNEPDSQKAYIKFMKIAKLLNFQGNLNISDIGKVGGTGRVSYIAKISKDTWTGSEKGILKDGCYTVNKNTYDIHLELSFDLMSKVIKLPLHYETNPYIPKKKLESNCNLEDYEDYINARNQVVTKLHRKIDNLKDNNINSYNGSNQIASITIKLNDNTTVKEFLDAVVSYSNKIALIVDDSLE
ncbi:MAG: hypothetical protein RR894_17545 [Terrisporobacter sp.]